MEFVLAAILEVQSNNLVSEAITDSSCEECKRFMASCVTGAKIDKDYLSPIKKNCQKFRIKIRGQKRKVCCES